MINYSHSLTYKYCIPLKYCPQLSYAHNIWYTGPPHDNVSSMEVEEKYISQEEQLPLLAVKGTVPNIFGFNMHVNLQFEDIFTILPESLQFPHKSPVRIYCNLKLTIDKSWKIAALVCGKTFTIYSWSQPSVQTKWARWNC